MFVWLLVTRRFRAAAVAAATGLLLLVVPWALIGFEGFREYPALLRAVDDIYAVVSLSTATVAAGVGISTSLALGVSALIGLVLVALAAALARMPDGDRRSFAVLVGACVLASPIVWQNYLALLFIPIALTWPRLAPAWFFGFCVWLAALLPKPAAPPTEPCCRPAGVPDVIWAHSHATPSWGHAGGTMTVALLVVLWAAIVVRAPGDELSGERRKRPRGSLHGLASPRLPRASQRPARS
jgi:hypothetical protein